MTLTSNDTLAAGSYETAGLDYTSRYIPSELLAEFTPGSENPVGIEQEVAAFRQYLLSGHVPDEMQRGYRQLGNLPYRMLVLDYFGNTAAVQHIPARSHNIGNYKITAGEKPCFLDPAGLSPGEYGIPYGSHSVIFGNLRPYLENHLVVVDTSHGKQALEPLLPLQ